MESSNKWPHTTAYKGQPGYLGDPVGVDLFDDQAADGTPVTAIYLRLRNGTRYGARTVNKTVEPHHTNVLDAWSRKGEVHDYRGVVNS